ncbi:hypothetical protein L2E82_00517 [Cichorium intybus]|uniref:Uncharacterized protein n=1 Tax=Cichorium intybus TaxID=13427 RepID=A0ACB9GWL6_CICIN|nr:hypothetical protein L2E82_00517 [Cichorium intybus]
MGWLNFLSKLLEYVPESSRRLVDSGAEVVPLSGAAEASGSLRSTDRRCWRSETGHLADKLDAEKHKKKRDLD